MVEGVIRRFYFPVYEADKRGNQWANCRYPKHFYNDAASKGYADALKSRPSQPLVRKLFMEMRRHIETVWTFAV